MLMSIVGSCQLIDSFDSIHWPNRPIWIGEKSKFQRLHNEIQLDDTAAGSSNSAVLLTPVSLPDTFEWEASCKMDFNPSSSNYSELIVLSSGLSLNESDYALWFRIGGQSGSVDDVRLYSRKAGEDSLLYQSFEGLAAEEPEIRIRLRIDGDGFHVEVDTFNSLADVFTAEYDFSFSDGFSGYSCRYSSSRADKIRFGPIFLSPRVLDEKPPIVSSLAWNELGEIDIQFSEVIVSERLKIRVNEERIDSIQWESEDRIHFISPGTGNLGIRIDSLFDFWENSSDTVIQLELYEALAYDILITEIHARPDEWMGSLPNAEFVEIWNRSDKTISLEGCMFQDASLEASNEWEEIGEFYLQANEVAILCDDSKVELFETFCQIIPLSSFPSLNNTEDLIILRNPGKELIAKARYNSRSFGSGISSAGGYSLQRQSWSRCDLSSEFSIIEGLQTGSPGLVADFTVSSFDSIPLRPRAIRLHEDSNLIITWPLSLDDETPGLIDSIWLRSNSYQPDELVELRFCDDRVIPEFRIGSFTWSTELKAKLVINEVLFNPYYGSDDFIELKNISDDYLILGKLTVAEGTLSKPLEIEDWVELDFESLVLAPDSVLYISTNCRKTFTDYPVSDSFNCLQVKSFVNLPDKGAWIALLDSLNLSQIIDSVSLSSDLHHPLIRNEDGISLRRINDHWNGANAENWASSPVAEGGASPGKVSEGNSQTGAEESMLSVSPSCISYSYPENRFEYSIELEETLSTVFLEVWSEQGYRVKTLLNNSLTGHSFQGSWNGFGENEQVLPSGNYMLILQVIGESGKVKKTRETVCLRY